MNKRKSVGDKVQNNSIVLLSGGIDSAACVHYHLALNFDVRGLFIDYGQLASSNERQAATQIAKHYGIKLDKVSFTSTNDFGPGEIRGRNAFFIMAALLVYPQLKGILCLGIHSGVPYYDCSAAFVRHINMILDEYTGGEVRIDTPLLTWDKAMIYAYCKEKDIPIYLTYSCEAGTDPPCGKCRSCKDREVLDAC